MDNINLLHPQYQGDPSQTSSPVLRTHPRLQKWNSHWANVKNLSHQSSSSVTQSSPVAGTSQFFGFVPFQSLQIRLCLLLGNVEVGKILKPGNLGALGTQLSNWSFVCNPLSTHICHPPGQDLKSKDSFWTSHPFLLLANNKSMAAWCNELQLAWILFMICFVKVVVKRWKTSGVFCATPHQLFVKLLTCIGCRIVVLTMAIVNNPMHTCLFCTFTLIQDFRSSIATFDLPGFPCPSRPLPRRRSRPWNSQSDLPGFLVSHPNPPQASKKQGLWVAYNTSSLHQVVYSTLGHGLR